MSGEPLDRHALGQALTRLANASASDLMRSPRSVPTSTPARRIGLTGAPGVGKSTLAGHLALYRAQAPNLSCRTPDRSPGQARSGIQAAVDDPAPHGLRVPGSSPGQALPAMTASRRVGILAIDPSSPRSGGAILGDRIRMDELAGSSELYIRSIGSRSTADGLSDNLPEMLDLMDEFGFSEVLLETVGVGQVEYAARVQVDTLALLLLPESGDVVQAMKAGIMEMADIYVINKADLPGAQKMAVDIRRITALARHEEGAWRPSVLLVSSSKPESVAALSDEIDRHQAWLGNGERREALLQQRARYRLRRLIERRAAEVVAGQEPGFFEAPIGEQLDRALQQIGRTR